MSWQVEFRPEVEEDVAEAARWYEAREADLGDDFIAELIEVWNRLTDDPFTGSHRHRKTFVRWRYPERFPYRVVYQVDEERHFVLVIAVLHAARHDRHWKARSKT
ncbi:type II toxin-antitoxin system RelE/ParE family toxin [Luteolibacter arcticus]|uniref:Type II toxin-antitoxin system RelE/ParE family toxin n=1 Tax=Luteolibacter arcticus TaxID=1581411 RepID=A0ABT3GD26_9BACT|nr:type II toxin-antitoxin system RelE/ParE family toxin [Luteolibacter arcticus]MCW1921537.1 type II toxin-antitoxin system RelE/ParE family toxin [Luteolibacter arcticus]